MGLKLIVFFLIYLLSFDSVSAQTLEPSATPTSVATPTASPDVSPTALASPTSQASSTPAPTSVSTTPPTPTPTPTSVGGQVLSGATELGDTGGGEFLKWLIALGIAVLTVGVGIKIAKSVAKADE